METSLSTPHIQRNPIENPPLYWKQTVTSNSRRAEWHDYKSKSIYMITILKNKDVNISFSEIKEGGKLNTGQINAICIMNQIGKMILRQLGDMERHYKSICVLKQIIMPDHLHVLIYVRERMDVPLGNIINYFKGNCTKEFSAIYSEDTIKGKSLFSKGFHDRIVRKEGLTDRLAHYIEDNPRRYLIKKMLPNLFTSKHIIFGNDEKLPAFGNFLLLKEPMKAVLTISRHDSFSSLKNKKRIWDEIARCRGVLVSPFISEEEKRLRDEYILRGASVIQLQNEDFSERFKPSGKYFDMCSAGRLLIIGEANNVNNGHITRKDCLRLNARAEKIVSSLHAEWRLVRR